MATILDVAREAKVSISTVSHVINRSRFVSEETRGRVVHAVAALNYQPNAVARSLRTKRTQMIALVIPDITNPYFPEVARGVQDAAEENNYAVVLCNTDRTLSQEVRLLKTLRQQRVEGIILNPSEVTRVDLQMLREAGISVVLIGSQIDDPEFDLVMVDNVEGVYDAVEHLIALGHCRIGLVGGPRTTSSGLQRFQGYVRALNAHEIPIEDDLITECAFTYDGGRECMKRLLALKPPTTAVFAANDVMALGALIAIEDAGLKVPDHVSLVGFDDIPEASRTYPKLTTIAQPKYQMGKEAARLLFGRIKSDYSLPRQKVVLEHKLVVRNSTAPPK